MTRVYRRDDREFAAMAAPGRGSVRGRARSRESPGTVATWSWSPRVAGFIASPRRPGGPASGAERDCSAVATARAIREVTAAKCWNAMMAEAHDVVIVGGGVIGLSIAYALAREGIRPTVLDRRDLGREASWAGAGLIPPVAENPSRQPLVGLRSWSARALPALVGRTRARDRHRHRLSPHRRRRRRLDRSRRPGAASRGRPLASRRNRVRAAGRLATTRGSSRH